MKKILLFLSVIIPLAGISQQVINDVNAEQRKVGSFNAIRVSNAIDLYISQGNEDAVAVSARDAETRSHIKTEVENGVLQISFTERSLWNTGNKKLKAYISLRSLEKLNASGASDVHITGTLKGNSLTMNLSGASDFRGNLDYTSLKIDLNGASDATISGTASELDVSASGASSFKGYDFNVEKCVASANGASDIKVTVNKELNAKASGASGVYYKGNGVIKDIKSSGASSISKKG